MRPLVLQWLQMDLVRPLVQQWLQARPLIPQWLQMDQAQTMLLQWLRLDLPLVFHPKAADALWVAAAVVVHFERCGLHQVGRISDKLMTRSKMKSPIYSISRILTMRKPLRDITEATRHCVASPLQAPFRPCTKEAQACRDCISRVLCPSKYFQEDTDASDEVALGEGSSDSDAGSEAEGDGVGGPGPAIGPGAAGAAGAGGGGGGGGGVHHGPHLPTGMLPEIRAVLGDKELKPGWKIYYDRRRNAFKLVDPAGQYVAGSWSRVDVHGKRGAILRAYGCMPH